MKQKQKDYEYCINIALDNAKKRIKMFNVKLKQHFEDLKLH